MLLKFATLKQTSTRFNNGNSHGVVMLHGISVRNYLWLAWIILPKSALCISNICKINQEECSTLIDLKTNKIIQSACSVPFGFISKCIVKWNIKRECKYIMRKISTSLLTHDCVCIWLKYFGIIFNFSFPWEILLLEWKSVKYDFWIEIQKKNGFQFDTCKIFLTFHLGVQLCNSISTI